MAEIAATNTDQSKYLASALGWREWILTPRIGPNLVLSGGVGQLPERITTNLPRRRRWRQRFDPAIAILDIGPGGRSCAACAVEASMSKQSATTGFRIGKSPGRHLKVVPQHSPSGRR